MLDRAIDALTLTDHKGESRPLLERLRDADWTILSSYRGFW
jgi:hypothetical protein